MDWITIVTSVVSASVIVKIIDYIQYRRFLTEKKESTRLKYSSDFIENLHRSIDTMSKTNEKIMEKLSEKNHELMDMDQTIRKMKKTLKDHGIDPDH